MIYQIRSKICTLDLKGELKKEKSNLKSKKINMILNKEEDISINKKLKRLKIS